MSTASNSSGVLYATAKNLVVEAETAEIVGAFGSAGIRTIVLKGPFSIRWLYGEATERFSRDVDLLVSPEDVDTAEGVLRSRGFTLVFQPLASDRPLPARTWWRASTRTDVDLHTSIKGLGVPEERVWTTLASLTEIAELGGASVEVLRAHARTMVVALHAAQHGAAEGASLEDLAHALERIPLAVWREAALLSEELAAVPAFVAGLELHPAGHPLVEMLELPRARSTEVALRAQTAPALALGLEWLATTPGLRAKGRFLFRELVPRRDFMRVWFPPARRGRLGLAAGYAWRPVWLAVNTPRAVKAWRRARNESGQSR